MQVIVGRGPCAVALAALVVLSAGCSTLLGPDATPVPGAAATLTRSINTPIPTPVRTASPGPAGSPSPSARVAVAASPEASPRAGDQSAATDADVANTRARLQQAVDSPDLSGIDTLLLDHVSMSTSQGGSVLDRGAAAQWLRDRAGPHINVTQVTRGTQDLSLVVQTDGWSQNDPIQSGQINFSLRRYDTNGRQDDSGGGEWKIDVIEVD